jgi:hypothetical protein
LFRLRKDERERGREERMTLKTNEFTTAYLKTEVGSSLADETEWSSDMYFHDNIKSVIWRGVNHLVECEPGVVHDVVNFPPFTV